MEFRSHFVREVHAGDEDALKKIVDLADRNRATLGLMPRSVFGDLAGQGCLLAVEDEHGAIAGYAMFALARGRVRLIHLCVAEAHRGRGVAEALVRGISASHPDTAGIVLKCRRDYEATKVWPALGFENKNEVPGRGRDHAPLVVWWRSHNLPDLLNTDTTDDEAMVVAIDHNVFIDLAIDPTREGAEESQVLLADWLLGQIVLKVTRESSNEIGRLSDDSERRRQRAGLSSFAALEYDAAKEDEIRDAWRDAVGPVEPEHASDSNHVVSAAAGRARVFVTRDEELIGRFAGPAADLFGLRIIRPSEVITHLDELENADRYRPADFRGTRYRVAVCGTGAAGRLSEFLDMPGGERRADYQRLLRRIEADPNAEQLWVQDPREDVVAAWAEVVSPGETVLEVPFLRIRPCLQVAPTLARAVVHRLRRSALKRSLTAVRVSDQRAPQVVRAALSEDGFVPLDDALVAGVLDVRSTSALLQAAANHLLRSWLEEAVVAGAESPQRVLELERAVWPAKLLDTDLSNYIVPIRRQWASELLGFDDQLLHRPDPLGISREHVYYRSPLNNPQSPARLVWYVSDTTSRGVGAVVAVSHLTAVEVDSPEVLYRRYQRLGVYSRDDIASSARNGVATALRFVDTEVFARHVRLEELREMAGARRLGSIQSPTMIDSTLFGMIYRSGTGREDA